MSKRLVSITYFVGTRKGVLTNRASTPSGGDLEGSDRFAKSKIGENWAFSRFLT
jgi:hypothetical protein